MPETLETIAEKITALGKSIDQGLANVDQRFEKVDQRFEKVDQRFATVDQQFAKIGQQFEETKAQLGVKIEAVDTKVGLVLEAVTSLQKHVETNRTDHKRFTERLDNHDLRILALESSKPAKP